MFEILWSYKKMFYLCTRIRKKALKDRFAIMKGIWNSFPADGKPEWLTWEQIEAYEAEMEAIPHRDQ